MVKILCWFIRCYKKGISPLFAPQCRFYPSCSTYFIQALETHGAVKGSFLGIKRLCRCHPLNEGGMDPVPTASCSHHHPAGNLPVDNKKEPGISHGY